MPEPKARDRSELPFVLIYAGLFAAVIYAIIISDRLIDAVFGIPHL